MADDIYLASERFREGYNLEDMRTYLGFTGTEDELRTAFKWHGLLIVRRLEAADLKRTWWRRKGIGKFQPAELQEIDNWLYRYPDLMFTIRLCRFHFQARIYDSKTFDLWLLRSGVAWRYCLREIKSGG